MEKQVTISVIMPVYNVEKYIRKAIDSMLSQTFTDFEFLIVDDGTPDSSGRICDEYAEKDSRIHVIHKENGGAWSARNQAIEIARGRYFYFMDSDDWAEPTMLEDMVGLAEKHGAQLVVTGFYIDTYYSDTQYLTLNVAERDAVFETQRDFRENAYRLFDKNLLYTPWNKLYLADYLRDRRLRFPNTIWDDFPFNLGAIRDIEKVVVSSRQYYHFMRARAESETAKYNPNMYMKREEEHSWMVELYRYWGIDDQASREMIARRYMERLLGCVENVTNPNCRLSRKEKLAQIRKILSGSAVKECGKVAVPRSLMMRLALLPVKAELPRITYLEGKVISKVKSRSTRLFTVLKASR